MAKKILLVDDTKTVIMFEKILLKGTGYHLLTAGTGEEALARVSGERPDLILLDIMMPGMDGIETCRRLKTDPDTRGIPVVMVTTKGDNSMIERAQAAGCDAYLTKPLERAALMEKVRAYLS